MSLFKKILPQEALADSIATYLHLSELKENPTKHLKGKYSDATIRRLVRACLYLAVVSLVKNFPNEKEALGHLLRKMYSEFLISDFGSLDTFLLTFKEEFPSFEQYLKSGEQSGNTMIYGASQWVLDGSGPKTDLIGLLEFSIALGASFVALDETLVGIKKDFRFTN